MNAKVNGPLIYKDKKLWKPEETESSMKLLSSLQRKLLRIFSPKLPLFWRLRKMFNFITMTLIFTPKKKDLTQGYSNVHAYTYRNRMEGQFQGYAARAKISPQTTKLSAAPALQQLYIQTYTQYTAR